MAIRFVLDDVQFEQPSSLGGSYLEGSIIISYGLNSDVPEARFFFQHDRRIPLSGTDHNLAAMLGVDSDDLNDVFDRLGQPGEDELLEQFRQQGRRQGIEYFLEGPYFVRIFTDVVRGKASATPYRAEAPTKEQRAAYYNVRDSLLSRIAAVRGTIQAASTSPTSPTSPTSSTSSTSSRPNAKDKPPDAYQDAACFLSYAKEEKAAIQKTMERIMHIRSDLRRYHGDGYLCLEKYAVQQKDLLENLILEWIHPFLTSVKQAVYNINEGIFLRTELDVPRFNIVHNLIRETSTFAREMYQSTYSGDHEFQQYFSNLADTAQLAMAFAAHAENINKAFALIDKQSSKLVNISGLSLRREKKKAKKLVERSHTTVRKNKKLFAELNLEGNSWGLDKVKALLLMKMDELGHQTGALQAAYIVKDTNN